MAFCGDVYKASAVSGDMHHHLASGRSVTVKIDSLYFSWVILFGFNQGERVKSSKYTVLCKFQKCTGIWLSIFHGGFWLSHCKTRHYATVALTHFVISELLLSTKKWLTARKCSEQSFFHYLNYPINQLEENETFGSQLLTPYLSIQENESEKVLKMGSKCKSPIVLVSFPVILWESVY